MQYMLPVINPFKNCKKAKLCGEYFLLSWKFPKDEKIIFYNKDKTEFRLIEVCKLKSSSTDKIGKRTWIRKVDYIEIFPTSK